MREFQFSVTELGEVESVLEAVATAHGAVDADFLETAPAYAQRMPLRLREALADFRHREREAVFLARGFRVDDALVGDTPGHWRETLDGGRTPREEFFLLLCASLLGEAFGWASQQGGRIVNEVVPIKEDAEVQINSSSSAGLLWHTEDAFHPDRADYIGLMCIRNPDRTATTVACVDDVEVADEDVSVLFANRFTFRPDDAHLPRNGLGGAASADRESDPEARLQRRAHLRIAQMVERPEKVSVLFGDPRHPYVRLDSDAIVRDPQDPMAADALARFMAGMNAKLREVRLEQGDLLFVDNYRSVHGRAPFEARFDRGDRWLKRVNITRDLRRSRDARASATSRVIY